MKYILMQEENGQIKIIDNSSNIGKKIVEEKLRNNCKYIGTIESDENTLHLMVGFNVEVTERLDIALGKLRDVRKVLDI